MSVARNLAGQPACSSSWLCELNKRGTAPKHQCGQQRTIPTVRNIRSAAWGRKERGQTLVASRHQNTTSPWRPQNAQRVSTRIASSVELAEAEPPPPESITALSLQGMALLLGSTLINFLAGTFYCWSCYVVALETQLGVGRALLSLVFSGGILGFCLGLNNVYPYVNHRKPATIAVGSVLLSAVGMAVSALAVPTGHVAFLFAGYSLCFGMGSGISFGLTLEMAKSGVFQRFRGLATGIIVSGRPLGAVAFAPLLQDLIEHGGVAFCFAVQCVALAAAAAAPLYALLAYSGAGPPNRRARAGECGPQGLLQDMRCAARSLVPDWGDTQGEGSKLGGEEAAGGGRMWALWGLQGFGGFAGLLMLSSAAPMMTTVGASTSAAALAVSLVNAFNLGGRLGGGWLCDRWGSMTVMLAALLLTAPPLLLASYSPSIATTQLALIAAGLVYGVVAMAVPLHVATTVRDPNNFSALFGKVFLAWGAFGVVGPFVGGYLYQMQNNYNLVVGVCGAANIVAALCGYLLLRYDSNKSLDRQLQADPKLN